MAIQVKTTILKLADDDLKTLGVSGLTLDIVTCKEGLKEGTDFAIDRTTGTVRRLKAFDKTLYTFVCKYDDGVEVRAIETAAVAADYNAAKAAVANLQAYNDLVSPTAAQTTSVVKLLCRVSIVLIKRVLGIS